MKGIDGISYMLNTILFVLVIVLDNKYQDISIGFLILGLFLSYIFLTKTYLKNNIIRIGRYEIALSTNFMMACIFAVIYLPEWERTQIIKLIYVLVFCITQILSIKITKAKNNGL